MASAPQNESVRIAQLLASIADVAPRGHPKPRSLQEASDAHQQLFKEYVAELKRSHRKAEEWVNGLVEGIMRRARKSKERAILEVRATSPAAPASYSTVLGTIRHFWLRCVELNDSVPAAERVPPEQFVLGWLTEGNHAELAAMISRLTYFPVGLDKSGHWV
jgi:hypothetical protein